MLNKKFIVAAVVAILAFFGILTFALDPGSDGSKDKDQTPNDNIQEESPSGDKEEGEEEETEETEQTGNQNAPRPVVSERPDTTAPVINGVIDGNYYNQDITITIDEENLDKVIVNGVEISLDENNQYTFSEDNVYVLVVSDKSNNSTAVTFTIDNTLPEITGVTDGGYYNDDVISNY